MKRGRAVDRKRRKVIGDIRVGERRELIETLWNVKKFNILIGLPFLVELIETLWNVKSTTI